MYISGIGAISTQSPEGEIKIPLVQEGKVRAIEPDYSTWIDPRLLRRMGRIVSMGVTAAFMALKDGGVKMPDAITTGTGFGCLEDTGNFLAKMVKQKEEGVNPTPFIQSTHNTIGSQVALLLGCHGHNQTFTHQSFSFEGALLDAKMLLAEHADQNVLVGAVDETTEVGHILMQRVGIFGNGVAQGEGAFYFLCTAKKQEESYARIINQRTLFKPASLEREIQLFLSTNEVHPTEIDLVLFGGMEQPWDRAATQTIEILFPVDKIVAYKKYSGEFATSVGFAVWWAGSILKQKMDFPVSVNATPQKILIYNPYLGNHHSLILLESCHGTK